MFVAHDVNASKKAPVPPVPDVDAKRANAQTRVVLALVAAALLAALALLTPKHASKVAAKLGVSHPLGVKSWSEQAPAHVDPFDVDAGKWDKKEAENGQIMNGRRFKVGDEDITESTFKRQGRENNFGSDLLSRVAETEQRFQPMKGNPVATGPDTKLLVKAADVSTVGYNCPRNIGTHCTGAAGRHANWHIKLGCENVRIYCIFDKTGALVERTKCGMVYPEPSVHCGTATTQGSTRRRTWRRKLLREYAV
ncbi:hypothetical protein PPROV_000767600 [Pycnococcus provasolii]|uniref:Uncharacterized protein n=2 Tax=Pycnococcus provasolii TaxID=41880 RepID=A0A830HVM1_9CHLO|nr:hypothetical protein PPROV_000767600 [Pycnococcus provasolii]